jgi:hypothetical protein
MRKAIPIICMIIAGFPVGAWALTGLSVGGKIGYADYSGDIFTGSGDLGAGTSYAVILGFGTVPVVDFEIQASYFSKDFDFAYDVGGVPVETSFEYRDVGMTALLKKSVFSAPGAPFAVYVGGGVGYHVINTEVAAGLAGGSVSPSDADNPFALMENTGSMSGEGMVGLKLSAPAFPLVAFGEFSYGVIFTSERLTQKTFAAGLMIRF